MQSEGDDDAAIAIARMAADRQRRFIAETESGTIGLNPLPLPAEPVASTTPSTVEGGARGMAAAFGGMQGTVSPAAIPINQTVYSAETVIIQNSITINVGDPDVRELKNTLGRLVAAIEGCNELSAEVRNQLRAEITAGKALLEAPKVERNAIQLYLLNSLRWIGEKVAAVIVTQLATRGLELLLKLLGS